MVCLYRTEVRSSKACGIVKVTWDLLSLFHPLWRLSMFELKQVKILGDAADIISVHITTVIIFHNSLVKYWFEFHENPQVIQQWYGMTPIENLLPEIK